MKKPVSPAGARILAELLRAKAIGRESGRPVSSTPAATPLHNAGFLDKATRKPAGGSQTTVYWLTEAGHILAINERKSRA